MSNQFYDFGGQAAKVSSGKKLSYDPSMSEYLKLTKGESAIIRVTNHPIWTFRQHTVMRFNNRTGSQTFRSVRCSRTEKATGGKCVGCVYRDREGSSSNIGARDVHVVTVLDLRQVHDTINDRGDKTQTFCMGSRCSFCKEKMPKHMVGRRFWPVGAWHFEVVKEVNLSLGDRCESCKTGIIKILTLKCKHCGEELFEEDDLFSMGEDVLKEKLFEITKCRHCGEMGRPEDMIECDTCDTPKRASISSTNLKVKRSGEKDSKGYTPLIVEPTYRFEDVNVSEIPPYDFEKVYPVYQLDEQAKRLGVENLYGVSEGVAVDQEDIDRFLKEKEDN